MIIPKFDARVRIARLISRYAPRAGVSDAKVHAERSGVSVEVVNCMRMKEEWPAREPTPEEALRVTDALCLSGTKKYVKDWIREAYSADRLIQS
jgi:hypothetical protein